MNDREILAAALRWHTAHVRRLEIGAEQRRYQQGQMKRTGFGGSSVEIGERLTAAKRPELAALRELAAICAKVRDKQGRMSDADVIDVPVLITYNNFPQPGITPII
jgi:hypothetical protein